MNEMPLVSIITPCFNAVRFVDRMIQSVHTQDYSNVEHILMDGGSTDGTMEIIKRYPHLIWVSETDRGQSHALNKGLQRAGGEIIGWLNADDTYEPHAITRAVQYLRSHPDIDLVYSDCNGIDENDLSVRIIRGHPVGNYRDLIFNQPIPQPTIFFRKGILASLHGMDESLHYVMDWEFWLRASLQFQFAYLQGERLANFRKYEGTKSRSAPRKFHEEWIQILERTQHRSVDTSLLEKGIRHQKALMLFDDVQAYTEAGHRSLALRAWFKAIQVFPSLKLWKSYLHLLFTLVFRPGRLARSGRSINVLYVQAGRGLGGAKISLHHLFRSLGDEKVNVHLVLSPPVDDIFRDEQALKISSIKTMFLPIWYKNLSNRPVDELQVFLSRLRRGGYIFPVLKLADFILKNRVDLVHSNSSATPVGALAAWLTGRRHIWHVREPIGDGTEFPLAWGEYFSAWLMRQWSARIVCISEYTAGYFLRHGIHPDVVVNGINVGEFDSAQARGNVLRKRLGLGSGPVIAMIGSLQAAWKEHALFLHAVALIMKKVPEARFVVFGGTSDLGQTEYTRGLQQLATSLNLSQVLTWADHLDDIPAMMHSFDLMIHPVSREGSGRVVMEAMAAGRPVVAVRAGGVPELVQEDATGFLVKPKDANTLAEAAIRLICDRELMLRIGNQAASYARHHFDHERTASHIFQIYQSVLGRIH